MEISKTNNPRQWTYKVNGKRYTITLDDTAELFLLKDIYEPTGDSKTGILKLRDIPIEKIFEVMIDGEYRDYTFDADDVAAESFDIAIHYIKNI